MPNYSLRPITRSFKVNQMENISIKRYCDIVTKNKVNASFKLPDVQGGTNSKIRVKNESNSINFSNTRLEWFPSS